MNEIIINNTPLGVKEYDGQRVVTFKDIDNLHERPEGTARKRFNDNREHFIEGVDYFVRNPDEAAKEFGIIAPNGLKLITETGYYMLVKSFTDDLSWDIQRELTNCYFRVQQLQTDFSALSPQLQFMIRTEQKQKKLEAAVEDTNRRINDMCEAMQVRGDNWRKKTHSLINRIASATGNEQSDIYLDIYSELEYRAKCDLDIRFNNLYNRLYERGVSQSKLDRLNNIDVIADDKRLTEIYLSIVKDMAIACNVWKNERSNTLCLK